MNNILCIMRRDLGAYFLSPIGYIFMMVFVTLSVGLYTASFFGFPVADMRPFFENLPMFLCIFLPAVTMRVWAEERKENTWEMLLTFPMQAHELVLGKFFAASIFFALTLFGTVTVPAMLFSLGDPDGGAIFTGYLGTFLVGMFFLSLGILFSGFFKDQIVAFVVTLLMCFALFLLGNEFIVSLIDDRIAGFGSMLAELLGFMGHYQAFIRGVVDAADILYFAAWTTVFLVLNILYIDGRNRPGAKTIFSAALAMSIAIGLIFNYLMSGSSLARFDLTEGKIYTVSPASKSILSELEAPVQLKLYITPKSDMPTGLKSLERDITDKLDEIRVASGGRIEYSTVPLKVANVLDQQTTDDTKKDGEEAIEKRMLDKGVQPFSVRAISEDEVSNKLIYSSIGVGYKNKPEEIISPVVPQSLPELEYRLVSTIYKLTREKPPVIALVAPKEAVNIDPQMKAMLMQMGQPIPESEDPYVYLEQILNVEKYDIRRVELTKASPLPEEFDTLVVINPRSLNERQRWEINRVLRSGKSVVMAVQNYEWNYQVQGNRMSVTRRDEKPEVNALLDTFGVKVSEDILMDTNRVPIQVRSGGNTLQDLLMGGQTVNLPMHVLVANESMDTSTAITSRIESVFYLWGSPLELNDAKLKEHNLDARVIMSSSPRAWTIPSTTSQLGGTDIEEPEASKMKAFPLMAKIEGQFPDAFAGKDRPAWPKPEPPPGQPPMPEPDDEPEPPAAAITPAPGKLILLGCSQMFRKDFLQAGNLDLFLNSVDAVSLNENLANVRGRKPINRMINRPSDGQKTMWRMANFGLANVVIASIGIGLFAARRRARNAYTIGQMGR